MAVVQISAQIKRVSFVNYDPSAILLWVWHGISLWQREHQHGLGDIKLIMSRQSKKPPTTSHYSPRKRLLFDEDTRGGVFHTLLYNEADMSLSDVWVMFTAGRPLLPTPPDNAKPSAQAKHGSWVILFTNHSVSENLLPSPPTPHSHPPPDL